jgi:hypothetical protein
MARLQISKLDNYIHILDMDSNVLYQEHSFRVLVRKTTPSGGTYDIAFLRPDSTPAAFYSATIGNIYDSSGAAWSRAGWEAWYQENTGDINTSAVVNVVTSPPTPQLVNPKLAVETLTTGLIGVSTTSISFSSIGTVAAKVSFDSNATFVSISPGTTINVSAGSEDRYYAGNQFGWDTTLAGASLLITYNSDDI